MIEVKVDLHDLRNIDYRLAGLPGRTQRKVLVPALKKWGSIIAREMKSDIPRRGRSRKKKRGEGRTRTGPSGTLRKSIGTRMKSYKKGALRMIFIGPRREEKFRSGGRYSTRYAWGVEKGFRGKTNYPAAPFVRNALARARQRFASTVRPEIGKQIEKIARQEGARRGKRLSGVKV